ncbi:MAG: hypothetical protein WBB77_03110, partial [Candidatus Nanopelagicales bacterium]
VESTASDPATAECESDLHASTFRYGFERGSLSRLYLDGFNAYFDHLASQPQPSRSGRAM